MKSIWKYELEPVEEQVINIPGGIPLSVGVQGHNESLVMWAEVVTGAMERKIRVVIRGTGHDKKNSDGKFLGTVQMPSGLVWHVFTTGV